MAGDARAGEGPGSGPGDGGGAGAPTGGRSPASSGGRLPFDRPGERSWCNPEAISSGRLPARAFLLPFPDLAAARRGGTPWCLRLDGRWRFELRDHPDDLPPGFAAPELDDGGWAEVEVPGNWTLQGFDRPHYTNIQMPFPGPPPRVPEHNPTGIYRRRFRLPAAFEGRRAVLHFGGAESVLYVFVNGEPVGFGKDSRLPQEFDVTGVLRPGENLVTAVVVRWSDASYVEDQDHWWMAGLHREVLLLSTGSPWIEDLVVRAEPEAGGPDGRLEVEVALGSTGAPPDDCEVEVRLEDDRERPALRAPLRGRIEHRGNPYLFRGDRVFLEARVRRPRPWSAEEPHLYRLFVSLRGADGRELQCVSRRIGFRRVEVRDRQLLLNGRPIAIRGVNRHDHDPVRGKAVTREGMRRDVELIKRANLNAVRTAHYPNDPWFYELCDELGLYVVDEANAECHAYWGSLADDPRYLHALLDRAERMVRRDRSHPSVLLWSLGNESGYGAAHGAMAGLVRKLDPSRPLHYEGALRLELSGGRLATDVICPMYRSVDDIVAWARSGADDRPLILCEFSHAMGNSNGSLREYFEAFEREPGLQGGFVWDWADQGLLRRDAGGRPWYAYGGDFGDEPHDENFCCNGLVGPDREPHPALFELAHLARPVAVEPVRIREGRIRVRSRRDFADLSDLAGRFLVRVDGEVVQRGRLPRLRIPARGSRELALPLRKPELAPGQEAFLEVEFSLRRDTPFAPAGFVVAREQIPLPWRGRQPRPRRARGPLEVAAGEGRVEVAAGEVRWCLDRSAGGLGSLRVGGEDLLAAGPALCLHRPPTDNDARCYEYLRTPGAVRFVDLGLDRLAVVRSALRCGRPAAHGLRVVLEQELGVDGGPARVRFVQVFDCLPGGDLLVWNDVDIHRDLAELARVGVVFALVPGFEEVEWFGRGPFENYADRKAAAWVGRHRAPVDGFFVPYVRPQAHGNRTDVRFAALHREAGPGLLVAGREPFEFSVGHFFDEDVARARHTHELRRRPETQVHVDAVQRGVGTGACGPDTLPPYRVGAGRYRFAYRLRPFQPGEVDPARLARERLHPDWVPGAPFPRRIRL